MLQNQSTIWRVLSILGLIFSFPVLISLPNILDGFGLNYELMLVILMMIVTMFFGYLLVWIVLLGKIFYRSISEESSRQIEETQAQLLEYSDSALMSQSSENLEDFQIQQIVNNGQ